MPRCSSICALLLATALPPGIRAQQDFEVASIRPAMLARVGGEGSGWEKVTVTPGRVDIQNAGLSFLIQWAYGVKVYQVSGPARLLAERYDVNARAAQPSGRQQMMTAMQHLLAERFRLRLHRETRSIPVYELLAPRSLARLKSADGNAKQSLTVENGSFVLRDVTMPEFAERLSDFSGVDRPVIDRTGMDGAFDITLESAAAAMRTDPDAVFAAVERAGFRLKASKAPLEILVVDHFEKPSPN